MSHGRTSSAVTSVTLEHITAVFATVKPVSLSRPCFGIPCLKGTLDSHKALLYAATCFKSKHSCLAQDLALRFDCNSKSCC